MVIYYGEKGTVVLYRIFLILFLIKILNINYIYADNYTSEFFDNILNNYQKTIKNEIDLESDKIFVFISFSMGDTMLKNYFVEAYNLKEKNNIDIIFVLRGFYKNSFQSTIKKVSVLLEDIEPVSIIVDPTLFLKYDIKQVPVIIKSYEKDNFNKISGSVSIQYSLEKFLEE